MSARAWRLARRGLAGGAATLLAVVLVAAAVSADVRFVLRGGYEQGRLLLRRRPLAEALADSTLPAAWRAHIALVIAARGFADSVLGLTPGSSFTSFASVGRDTLVLVLSASPKNAIEPYLWRFPIVGAVPYRGFFSLARARAAVRDFEAGATIRRSGRPPRSRRSAGSAIRSCLPRWAATGRPSSRR